MNEGLNQLSSKTEKHDDHVLISDGVRYSVDKLIDIAKTLVPEEMAISEFDKSMETECWDDSEGRKLRPKEVLEAIRNEEDEHPELKEHIERVKNSDTKHPILIANTEGELVVIDGVHRLVKSFIENKTSILGVKFNSLPKEARILG